MVSAHRKWIEDRIAFLRDRIARYDSGAIASVEINMETGKAETTTKRDRADAADELKNLQAMLTSDRTKAAPGKMLKRKVRPTKEGKLK